jgi:biopolymer transport protein TolR
VLVAGDKNAKYEAVLDVLDSIKQQDVKRVGLETVRKQ